MAKSQTQSNFVTVPGPCHICDRVNGKGDRGNHIRNTVSYENSAITDQEKHSDLRVEVVFFARELLQKFCCLLGYIFEAYSKLGSFLPVRDRCSRNHSGKLGKAL